MHEMRSIEFDEVFQDGKAKHKHQIIDYPKRSGNWFIFRCDQHNEHFGNKPMHSVMRHLFRWDHGRLLQGGYIAIRELGVRVLNCDHNKADRNNAAFDAALRQGYKPLKGGSHSGNPSQRRGRQQAQPQPQPQASPGPSPKPSMHGKPFDGVTEPVPGELYLGHWAPRHRWYVVVVLPCGDFRVAGVSGSIYESPLIKSHIPLCYEPRSSKNSRPSFKWAKGFEKGGPNVTRRKFPVMFCDDEPMQMDPSGFAIPPPVSLGWLSAASLRPFSEFGPNGMPPLGHNVAMRFVKSRRLGVGSTAPSHLGGQAAGALSTRQR